MSGLASKPVLYFIGIPGPRSGWVNKLRRGVLTISFLPYFLVSVTTAND